MFVCVSLLFSLLPKTQFSCLHFSSTHAPICFLVAVERAAECDAKESFPSNRRSFQVRQRAERAAASIAISS